MNKLPASAGWAWLKQGAALFGKQPGRLTILLFANILISLAFSAVPWLGSLLAVVLIPSFSMAFMQACYVIDSGKSVTPSVILTGFRKPAVAALCKLGLVYLAVTVVMSLLARLLIDDSFWQAMMNAHGVAPKELAVDASDVFTMFGISLLEFALLITLAFAAPLTYWEKMGTGKATFYSFFAVVRNARVFGVLLLAWFGMFFALAIVVALVLTRMDMAQAVLIWLFFLFMLLLQCAIYVGYRTIFGKPVEPRAHAI